MSKVFWHVCFVSILISVSSLQSFAQSGDSNIKKELWYVRAEKFTDELAKATIVVNPLDSAIIWARLSDIWWDKDSNRAKQWAIKATDIVEKTPNKETNNERKNRITAARIIFRMLANRDEKINRRLMNVLLKGGDTLGDDDRNANADAIVNAALTLIEKDPQKAAELGLASLHYGLSDKFQSLMLWLRSKSPNLADKLLTENYKVARSEYNIRWLAQLREIVFPESNYALQSQPKPSDDLRTQLLQIYLEAIQHYSKLADCQQTKCELALGHISPLMNQYRQLLPTQLGIAQQAVSQCSYDTGSVKKKLVEDEQNSYPLNAIEDFLDAALKAKDKDVAATYLGRAANLAAQQKKYERAIKILDDMDEYSRKFIDIWATWRRSWAVAWALERFKSGDIASMFEIIKTVPDDLRPVPQVSLASKLYQEKANVQIVLELLNEGRKGVNKSNYSEKEKFYYLMDSLRLYAKYQMQLEAIDTFKETIDALNQRIKSQAQSKSELAVDEQLADSLLQNFPASLLEERENSVANFIASLDSVNYRIRISFDMLELSLNEYKRLSSVSKKEKTQ
jgi:hypothetical protein